MKKSRRSRIKKNLKKRIRELRYHNALQGRSELNKALHAVIGVVFILLFAYYLGRN